LGTVKIKNIGESPSTQSCDFSATKQEYFAVCHMLNPFLLFAVTCLLLDRIISGTGD